MQSKLIHEYIHCYTYIWRLINTCMYITNNTYIQSYLFNIMHTLVYTSSQNLQYVLYPILCINTHLPSI